MECYYILGTILDTWVAVVNEMEKDFSISLYCKAKEKDNKSKPR